MLEEPVVSNWAPPEVDPGTSPQAQGVNVGGEPGKGGQAAKVVTVRQGHRHR